jgi:signal transduction histidine kinase
VARRRSSRSISGPIILSSLAVALTLFVLVAWIWVISKNASLTQQWSANLWLLVAGILSFATIMTVLVLFSVFLAREILEVRRQTTFIDSVTHELKSPLASIRLCLETLSRPELNELQRSRLREMMLGDVERLDALIEDVLQASRLEYGEHGHGFTEVDVVGLVQRVVSQASKRHRMLPEDVDVRLPEVLPISTDPVALELVVKNLVDNAIKYSDPPAHVTVIADTRENGGLHLEVIDRGVGIPRRALKRVFERFYRVDSEAVRGRRGTGLGLYVVASTVRRLGGHFRAFSAGPGTGTRMVIDLPEHRGAAERAAANKDASEPEVATT